MKRFTLRSKVYRGKEGFSVGSAGGHGWPIRIFVEHRDAAERIRQAYRDEQAGKITAEERDDLVDRNLSR
jgi:hypothetical protein